MARRPNPAILAVVLFCILAQAATAVSTCNVFGCAKCDPEDPDVCTQCRKGYALDTEGACGCAVGYATTMSAAGRLIKAPRSFPADCDTPDGPKPSRTTCRCRRCPRGFTSAGGPVEATTQCVEGAKGQASTSGGQASLTLSGCGVSICNAAAYYGWGVTTAADPTTLTSLPNTARWTTVVTKSVATNIFKIGGVFSITNTGAIPAPIGNIVVNLQTRALNLQNKWVWKTIATDAADAARGDLAGQDAIVKVVSGASSENQPEFPTSAKTSGALKFNDHFMNTGFARKDTFKLDAGASVDLTYVASFKDLNLLDGTPVRTEVIVSFSDAGARGGSGASKDKLDITGDGAPEFNVRSVPCRTTLTVPPLRTVHNEVTLSDAITSEGGPTCTAIGLEGAVTPLTPPSTCLASLGNVATLADSAKGFPVTADVSAGQNGAKLFNTAAVTSFGYSVTVNDTFVFSCVDDLKVQSNLADVLIDVPLPTPQPAPQPAPVITYKSYGQGAWHWQQTSSENSAERQPIKTRNAYFQAGGSVTVGGTYKMTFNTAAAVDAYLPVNRIDPGPPVKGEKKPKGGNEPAALNATLTNPTSTSAGVFGGQVLALKLNVDLLGDGGIGKFYVCGAGDAFKGLNGKTVAQVLDAANVALGGGALPAGIADIPAMNDVVDWLNGSCGDDKTACTATWLPSSDALNINLSHDPCST